MRFSRFEWNLIVYGTNSGTITVVTSSARLLEAMRRNPQNIRFADLFKVCAEHFGEPRQNATSHAVFKTPWVGDPRINIQNDKGKAKAYQVRQVLLAIDKLEEMQYEAHQKQQEPEE